MKMKRAIELADKKLEDLSEQRAKKLAEVKKAREEFEKLEEQRNAYSAMVNQMHIVSHMFPDAEFFD